MTDTLLSVPPDGRQSEAARAIQRGAMRYLAALGLFSVPELSLASGRRADITAVDARGEIWIVEIKSSVIDFRTDRKWHEYRQHCDRLFFAVAPGFPVEILPEDTGLLLADAFGAALQREAPRHPVPAHVRRAVTLHLARTAAGRLQAAMDPEGLFPRDL